MYGSTFRQIAVFAINSRVVKRSGVRRSRNDNKRTCNRTRNTVGRTIDNLKRIFALGTSNERGRTTTIKVDCVYTTSCIHNLRKLTHITTTRERFLTTVKYHKDNLTRSRNTDSGTACTVTRRGSNNLTVFYEGSTETADSVTELTSVNFIIFFRSTDNRFTFVRNTEEPIAINAVVFFAVHNEQATNFTRGHIEPFAVDTCNNVVVFNIVFTFGVTVLILCRIRLVKHTRHLPLGGIVIRVVCVNGNVISRNISRSEIVNDLLTIRVYRSIPDFLRNTGRKRGSNRVKHFKNVIFSLFYVVTCKLAEIIRERITASSSQIVKIRNVNFSRTLKGRDKLVAGVSIVNSLTHHSARTRRSQTPIHEEGCACYCIQFSSEIPFKDLRNCTRGVLYTIEGFHNIERVKVAVNVKLVERRQTRIARAYTQIVLSNVTSHFFQATANLTLIARCGKFKKVNEVTCPTRNVSVVYATIVVIGNIHRTENVSDIRLLAIRKSKVSKVLKARNLKEFCRRTRLSEDFFVQCRFHIRYETRKVSVFITCHNTPRTGVITVNTRTDILDNKRNGVFCRVSSYVFVSNFFQKNEVLKEFVVRINRRFTQRRNHFVVGSVTAFRTSVICGITVRRIGGSLVFIVYERVGNFIQNLTAYRTGLRLRAGSLFTGGMPKRDYFVCNVGMIAMRAGIGRVALFRAGRSSNDCVIVMTKCLYKHLVTYRTDLRGGAGSFCAFRVTLCRDFFLSNEHFVTYGTMLTFRKTSSRTGRSNGFVYHFRVTKRIYNRLRNENFTTYGTMLAFGKTRFRTGRSNGFVYNFRVTKRIYNRLCNENFTAYGTMLTFGKTRFRAGRSNGFVYNFRVTKRIYNRLRNENFTAYGTMLAFGKTRSRTSGSNGFVYNFRVTKRIYNRLRNGNFVTYGTMLAFRKTSSRTSSFNRFIYNFRVSKFFYFVIRVGITATRASMRGVTLFRTGRSSNNCLVIVTKRSLKFRSANRTSLRLCTVRLCAKLVTRCRHYAIRVSIIANRAGMRGVAVYRTGRIGNLIFIIVPRCSYYAVLVGITANRAGMRGVTVCRAGRSGNNFFIIVTLCRHFFLCNGHRTTYGAMLTFRKTSSRTGRSNCLVYNFRVTVCSYYAVFVGITANRAGMRGVTVCRAGRSGNNFFIIVTCCRNFFLRNEDFTTYGTMLTFGKTRFRTGRSNCLVYHFRVTKRSLKFRSANRTSLRGGAGSFCAFRVPLCRNFFLRNEHFTTHGTMLTFGKTRFRTSGCNRAISNFLMLTNFRPYAIRICICTIVGLYIRSIRILQLRRRDRNFNVTRILNQLMGNRLRASIKRNTCIFSCTYICTTSRSVYVAVACINRAVNGNFSVFKVCFRSCIFSGWSIYYGKKFHIVQVTRAVSKDISSPFIGIVYVNANPRINGNSCVFSNNNFGAREHCNILVNSDCSACGLNRNIAVNAKVVVFRVNRGSADGEIYRV